MGDGFLVAKMLIVAIAAITTLALVRSSWVQRLSLRRFTLLVFGLLLSSRLGLFLLTFVVARIPPQSDVVTYYMVDAKSVLTGNIPYADFTTAYAPGFPYLASLIVRVWDSPVALILFAVLIETVALAAWLAVSRRCFDEAMTRRAAILYVTSPLVLINVAVDGQNQVLLAALLGLSLLFSTEGRTAMSGFACGLSVACVKALGLIYAPVLWAGADRKIRWGIAFLAPAVAAYVFVFAEGATVQQVTVFARLLPSSGNLPFYLGLAGLHLDSGAGLLVVNLAAAAAMATVFLLNVRFREPLDTRRQVWLLALVLLTFLLISRKSLSSYLVTAFFPVCLLFARRPVSLPLPSSSLSVTLGMPSSPGLSKFPSSSRSW